MKYLPTFMDIAGRSCLVAGGGEAALSKIRLLLKAGAEITVVADTVVGEIESLADSGQLTWHPRPFQEQDVQGRCLVYGAHDDIAADKAVSRAAETAGIPVNVVDRPALSSFITPAIVDRNPIVIGISSAGTAPILARRIRSRIESLLPAGTGKLAEFAASFRGAVKATMADGRTRRRFWENFFAGPLAEQVLAGEEVRTREAMLGLINKTGAQEEVVGSVALVGAGPGDPDLLTLKALRLLQEADVLVYDKLVASEIIDYARRDAERIFVGKSKGHHSKTQDEINQILLGAAQTGHKVVRVKGGDPFVFGRGGEEQAFLEHHGITVEVVPGITAATGCAAAAGIPLTERNKAQAVTLVTGHGQDGDPELDWASLANSNQTIAIYMGVATAGQNARRLIEQGLSPRTPVAVIENGTRPTQRVLTCELAGLGHLMAVQGVSGPALIIIGEVARAAKQSALPAQLAAAAV
ncbi:MAG: siroheme synthase CysG [Pseudomonadota bacterium]